MASINAAYSGQTWSRAAFEDLGPPGAPKAVFGISSNYDRPSSTSSRPRLVTWHFPLLHEKIATPEARANTPAISRENFKTAPFRSARTRIARRQKADAWTTLTRRVVSRLRLALSHRRAVCSSRITSTHNHREGSHGRFETGRRFLPRSCHAQSDSHLDEVERFVSSGCEEACPWPLTPITLRCLGAPRKSDLVAAIYTPL